MIIQIPIPQQHIGKWCVVENYNTSASPETDILWENTVFESEEQATLYLQKRFKFQTYNIWQYYHVKQIQENYPILQVHIKECSTPINHLQQDI